MVMLAVGLIKKYKDNCRYNFVPLEVESKKYFTEITQGTSNPNRAVHNFFHLFFIISNKIDCFTVPKHCDDEFLSITKLSSPSLTTTNLQQPFDSSANSTGTNSTNATSY